MNSRYYLIVISALGVALLGGMSQAISAEKKVKVLHITFHEGCKNDFEEVARELGLDVTTWFVQHLPQGFWEGFQAGNEIYNVGPRRAQRVWNRHKDFFNQFDLIVTSDTVPLSRIFLQNGWEKPLIIWICNRFDYAHGSGGEDRFPDRGYYDLIRQATLQKNVRLIAYTPFEHEYMRRRGIEMGTRTIKPLGTKEQEVAPDFISAIPADKDVGETLFIFPRLDEGQIDRVKQGCASEGIATWSGVYNGPEDLKQFKGVIFFPYQFSNLALFENVQRGIIQFVPTRRLMTQLFGYLRDGVRGNLQWMEWYLPENEDCFVYFDSWADLGEKMETVDYVAMRQKIKVFGEHHRSSMLSEWQKVLEELL